MGFILAIILGAIIGYLASLVTGRDAEQGIVGNILVGITGAFIGGFIASLFNRGGQAGLVFDATALFWSFVGAVVLSVIINLVTRRRVR